jgi:catechol 2,3-dioxygenase-like lactoylglutathione lyase family enzyme
MLQRILAFTLTVEDLVRSQRAYCEAFGWHVRGSGHIDEELARALAAPEITGYRTQLLSGPGSDAPFLRLIEQESTAGYQPGRHLGWAAIEICVSDVYDLARRLEYSPFRIAVAPRPIPWGHGIHAMQVLGPDGELLYLTQLPADRLLLDLTPARYAVDRPFIAVLACRSLARSRAFYSTILATPVLPDSNTEVQIVNATFGLSPGHRIPLGIVKLPREFLIEMDEYPAAAQPRPRKVGALPPGIAAVSFASDTPQDATLHKMPPRVGPDGEWLDLDGLLAK